MAAERAGARAWHIDEHRIDWPYRGMPRVSDEGKDIGRLEPPLVGEQSLESSHRFVTGENSRCGPRQLERLPAGRRAQIRHGASNGNCGILGNECRRWILDEEQSF